MGGTKAPLGVVVGVVCFHGAFLAVSGCCLLAASGCGLTGTLVVAEMPGDLVGERGVVTGWVVVMGDVIGEVPCDEGRPLLLILLLLPEGAELGEEGRGYFAAGMGYLGEVG